MSRIKPVRNAARAVIIHEGKLLAVKMRDYRGVFYILPGGGQLPGETLAETVKRECLEEVGAHVEVGDLIYVREYIGKNHTFKKGHHSFHQLEAVFLCTLASPELAKPGHEQDKYQTGVSWIDLSGMHAVRFFPEAIKEFFSSDDISCPRIYLGDIN